MRYGIWNTKSLHWAGSLTAAAAAARELAKYKLDIVDVQKVRWDYGGAVRAGISIFSMEKETKIINW